MKELLGFEVYLICSVLLVVIICLVLQTGAKGRACLATASKEMLSSDRVEIKVFIVTNQHSLKDLFQVPQECFPLEGKNEGSMGLNPTMA